MSSALLEMYRQAAYVIASMINQKGYALNRKIPLNRHRWYSMLDPYDPLYHHFKDHEISALDMEWLRERALYRNEGIIFSDYTPIELFLDDVLDIMYYYHEEWQLNPPKGYAIPETFYL